MLPPYKFYWLRIDNKHMTEPWLDQALMESANNCVVSDFSLIEAIVQRYPSDQVLNLMFLLLKLFYLLRYLSE